MRYTKNTGKIIAAVLAVSLCVTGCSIGKKSSKVESGDVSSGSVVMIVGDHQVKYSEVLAYCYFLKCQYEESFGKELWSYELSEGETIGDQAKQEIVNMITQLKIISSVAEKEGVSLSAEEQDEALQQAQTLVNSASDEDREEYALTVQEISNIYQENSLAEKMFYVATDDADSYVSDEEATQWVQANTESSGEDGEEQEQISEDALAQAKETIIEERQSEMFVKKYNEWLQDKDVDINQSFWNEFQL
jgi:DNA uptake protein ComE-like DNA-binding protein